MICVGFTMGEIRIASWKADLGGLLVSLQIFPERCPLSDLYSSTERTQVNIPLLGLHLRSLLLNSGLQSVLKALNACAILRSMSGCILPDNVTTDHKCKNPQKLEPCHLLLLFFQLLLSRVCWLSDQSQLLPRCTYGKPSQHQLLYYQVQLCHSNSLTGAWWT